MKLTSSILVILLTGCTTVGENFAPLEAPNENFSITYVYHDCNPESNKYYTGGFEGPEFRVNNEFIGYLASDSYIPLTLPIGEVKMELLPTWNYTFIPKLKFNFDINNTNPRYFKYTFEGTPTSYNQIELEALIQQVTPSQGEKEIQDCQLNKAGHNRAIKSRLSL